MKNGVWKNAKKVSSFKDISGTWKCLNTYDPIRKMGKYCRDISNVTISGTEGNTTISTKTLVTVNIRIGLG